MRRGRTSTFQRKDSILSRAEIYPWSTLTQVGDFFVVSETVRPYSYVAAYVSQRNHRLNGEMIYACRKIPGATYVSLAYYEGWSPVVLEEFGDNIWVGRVAEGGSGVSGPVGIESIAAKVAERETQEKRVARLSLEHKMENLPWWWDKGKPLLNSRVLTESDRRKYGVGKQPVPGPNEPYPSYYNLDENFIRHVDEDEDSGEYFEEPEL